MGRVEFIPHIASTIYAFTSHQVGRLALNRSVPFHGVVGTDGHVWLPSKSSWLVGISAHHWGRGLFIWSY